MRKLVYLGGHSAVREAGGGVAVVPQADNSHQATGAIATFPSAVPVLRMIGACDF
jgi:hypothetical protein